MTAVMKLFFIYSSFLLIINIWNSEYICFYPKEGPGVWGIKATRVQHVTLGRSNRRDSDVNMCSSSSPTQTSSRSIHESTVTETGSPSPPSRAANSTNGRITFHGMGDGTMRDTLPTRRLRLRLRRGEVVQEGGQAAGGTALYA